MGSNKIVINGTIKYEIPDSWMPPLMEYLELMKTETDGNYKCYT